MNKHYIERLGMSKSSFGRLWQRLDASGLFWWCVAILTITAALNGFYYLLVLLDRLWS